MDKTAKYFDHWANIGRSEDMEKGHGTTVNKFLDKISFEKKFSVSFISKFELYFFLLSLIIFFCICNFVFK